MPVSSDPAYDFSEQVGHLLRRAYQRHTALFQQFIPDSQLTVAQFVVLCALRDHSGSSLSDIVKATVIDQATIRGVIDRLKSRELLQVDLDPLDRRKVAVSLTTEGARLVAEMEPYARTISEQTFGPLNPAERVALIFLLRKLCIGDAELDPEP
jgi:DNA-binding MarR family transcriptional regulator